MRIKGLDHVGLLVADMERTLRFYRDGLGLTVLRTKGPDDDGVRSAVIQVGDQEMNVFSAPNLGKAHEQGGAGVDHFCFAVEAASIEDVIAQLRAAGLEIAKGPTERRSATSIFLSDPDGVRVELQLPRQP